MPRAQPGQRFGGRQKGTPNKSTASVKDAMQAVYRDLQASSGSEHKHFEAWARDNSTEFYKLYSKLLPMQVGGDPDGVPVMHEIVQRIVDTQDT